MLATRDAKLTKVGKVTSDVLTPSFSPAAGIIILCAGDSCYAVEEEAVVGGCGAEASAAGVVAGCAFGADGF